MTPLSVWIPPSNQEILKNFFSATVSISYSTIVIVLPPPSEYSWCLTLQGINKSTLIGFQKTSRNKQTKKWETIKQIVLDKLLLLKKKQKAKVLFSDLLYGDFPFFHTKRNELIFLFLVSSLISQSSTEAQNNFSKTEVWLSLFYLKKFLWLSNTVLNHLNSPVQYIKPTPFHSKLKLWASFPPLPPSLASYSNRNNNNN